MNRVGIALRLRAIRDAAQRHDPSAYALHNLTPKLRLLHDEWRDECNRIAVERYGADPSARYEALLDCDDLMPPMPRSVAAALNIRSTIGIPASATVDDASEIYRKYTTGKHNAERAHLRRASRYCVAAVLRP